MAESGAPVVLGNGLVVLRNALSVDQQKWLAEYAMEAGHRPAPKGWFTDQGSLNATKTRGRLYDEVKNYPQSEKIRKVCLDLVGIAKEAQPKLPAMDLTHMLLLLYSAEGMDWHRDSDPNDGDNDHPIVSISLGNSSEFGYKPLLQPEQSVVLRSGDVLIWEAHKRMLEHCVAAVHPNTVPSYLEDILPDSRINFTFRSARNILGKTEEFGNTYQTFA